MEPRTARIGSWKGMHQGGDSGTGVQGITNDGRAYLIGAVSFGPAKCASGGVFTATNISKYITTLCYFTGICLQQDPSRKYNLSSPVVRDHHAMFKTFFINVPSKFLPQLKAKL
ncbi:unnamed protein product [Anisakis simplex]|uniref:Peptidase S1 domain-containing protein n=1 Tax=Anisakis simplex TaxID=6269 RepID=A0A0M3K1A5_ANISI|nr:unnamed protein product [Anisakis simplex]